jgi:hypothetical protein
MEIFVVGVDCFVHHNFCITMDSHPTRKRHQRNQSHQCCLATTTVFDNRDLILIILSYLLNLLYAGGFDYKTNSIFPYLVTFRPLYDGYQVWKLTQTVEPFGFVTSKPLSSSLGYFSSTPLMLRWATLMKCDLTGFQDYLILQTLTRDDPIMFTMLRRLKIYIHLDDAVYHKSLNIMLHIQSRISPELWKKYLIMANLMALYKREKLDQYLVNLLRRHMTNPIHLWNLLEFSKEELKELAELNGNFVITEEDLKPICSSWDPPYVAYGDTHVDECSIWDYGRFE